MSSCEKAAMACCLLVQIRGRWYQGTCQVLAAEPRPFNWAPPSFESWIIDYFYPTLEWVLSAGNQVVDTTVTGLVVNGLTHVHQAQSTQFVCELIWGLVGSLTEVNHKRLIMHWAWYTRRHLTQGGHWIHFTMRRQVVWPSTILKWACGIVQHVLSVWEYKVHRWWIGESWQCVLTSSSRVGGCIMCVLL